MEYRCENNLGLFDEHTNTKVGFDTCTSLLETNLQHPPLLLQLSTLLQPPVYRSLYIL